LQPPQVRSNAIPLLFLREDQGNKKINNIDDDVDDKTKRTMKPAALAERIRMLRRVSIYFECLLLQYRRILGNPLE
jgi:hypothetical protein